MSSSLCLLIFLLCLLVRACNARHLVFVTNQSTENEVHFLGKQDDEINLGKSEPRSLVVVDEVKRQTQEEFSGIHETKKGAVTMKQKLIKAFFKAKQGISRAITGYDEIANSSEDDLPKAAKIEGLRRHGRSVLGPLRNAKATLVSEENNTVEDMVEMDYAQPHRKPPIHNETP